MEVQVIINADDFGMSETVNEAIAEGYKNGIITSTSIMPNMPAFDDAVKKLRDIPEIGLAVHLNIIEGKALISNTSLCNSEGNFYLSFGQIMLNSLSPKFLKDVEAEFRAQIEKVLMYAKPDNLDSHVHVHAIPPIFNIVCKLAKEYNIPTVRTQYEHLYNTPNHTENFSKKHCINFIKVFLLNFLTRINKILIKQYDLKTNDCVIGVGYTAMMNEQTINFGLQKQNGKDCLLEVICHPDKNTERTSNYNEYKAVLNDKLKNIVPDFNPTNFSKI